MKINKFSYALGCASGVILTIVLIIAVGLYKNSESNHINYFINYFDNPISYESKSEAYFKVIQVLGDAALASEKSYDAYSNDLYLGNTVLLIGDNFYDGRIIKVPRPQQVGTFSYTNKIGNELTVPVIELCVWD